MMHMTIGIAARTGGAIRAFALGTVSFGAATFLALCRRTRFCRGGGAAGRLCEYLKSSGQ